MIIELLTRNRQLAIRLALALLIFTLLGTTLALLLRKVQSQQQLVALHTRILANMPLLQAETTSLHQQVSAFRQAMPVGLSTRSPELQLYTRLDQIKSTLEPQEMTVTSPENKDGILSVSFTLKVRFSDYSKLVNGMGHLQTSLVPFVDFSELTLTPTGSDSMINVAGSVIMPPINGGTP